MRKRRQILTPKGPVTTPLLVPSFSSKGFPDHMKIMKVFEETFFTPTLISAYDIYYETIRGGQPFPRFDSLPLVIVDSGGYEANKHPEFSDTPKEAHQPKEWSSAMHEEALAAFSSNAPLALVTYDHPSERMSLEKQIERARAFKASHPQHPVIFLAKPETADEDFVRGEALRRHVNGLADFAAIGVTEDEAGRSLVDRMVFIARLRAALDAAGNQAPIHVFGSLDTLITLMYFAAGADVFDGLTWLRYSLYDDQTLYRRHYPLLTENLSRPWDLALGLMWQHNYGQLIRQQEVLERFCEDGSYDQLPRGALVEKAVNLMNAKLRGA